MPLGADFLAFVRTTGPAARLRLAPTPSGFLHAGNALNFTLNWLAARLQPGAALLLRIDDLDADRKRPEYVADIFESLRWLGLDWDEGPVSPENFEANWSQTRRIGLYARALAELQATGLVYACAKSRQDLAPFGGHYPIDFRQQNLFLTSPNVAWRMATPPGFPLPDFIVRRRDGLPAYQLASLVDDLHFGITHVIRGADLQASTAAQQWLARQLGWTAFQEINFLHHPLLTDEQGVKLSKSAGAASLQGRHVAPGSPPWPLLGQVAALLDLPADRKYTADSLLNILRTALMEKDR